MLGLIAAVSEGGRNRVSGRAGRRTPQAAGCNLLRKSVTDTVERLRKAVEVWGDCPERSPTVDDDSDATYALADCTVSSLASRLPTDEDCHRASRLLKVALCPFSTCHVPSTRRRAPVPRTAVQPSDLLLPASQIDRQPPAPLAVKVEQELRPLERRHFGGRLDVAEELHLLAANQMCGPALCVRIRRLKRRLRLAELLDDTGALAQAMLRRDI
jgi:hypothetical protein